MDWTTQQYCPSHTVESPSNPVAWHWQSSVEPLQTKRLQLQLWTVLEPVSVQQTPSPTVLSSHTVSFAMLNSYVMHVHEVARVALQLFFPFPGGAGGAGFPPSAVAEPLHDPAHCARMQS